MAIDAAGTAVAKLREHAEREREGLAEERDRQTATRNRQAAWARDKVREADMLKPAEAQKLAENLHAIVAEACGSRPGKVLVRKADILAKAGMRDSDGKSRVLYRYTLDPTLPEETRKRRGRQVIKHPANYLKIADAAARLAGLDADDVVCRLIAGTRLAEGVDTLPDDFQPEYLDMLAKAIQGRARRISNETKLDWYFRTIEAHGITPTCDAWTTDGGGELWFHGTLPTVELITLELTERTYQGVWSSRLPDGSDGPVEVRTARPCLRWALTLAPLGTGKEVRAYFMRRHVLAVRGWADEATVGWAESHLAEFNVEVVGWLGEQGRSCNTAGTFRLHGTELSRFIAEQGLIEFESDDHAFLEVTPVTIAGALTDERPDAPWVRDDTLGQTAMHVTKSPPGTRIAVLEDVLHHGRNHIDIGTPLMALVEKDARQRVASLRSWWDGEQAKIEDVFSRMKSGGSAVSNLPAKPLAPSVVVGRSDHMPFVTERQSSRLVALDFETAAPYDHIVEIGAVEIMDGELTGRTFHRLVRPRVPIDGFTAAIHGITDRKVARRPHFADTATAFLDFLGDALIVAHAAHVERTVLERELMRLGHEALSRTRFLCTLSLARRSRRFLRNGLRDVCEALEITVKEARNGFHDALGDAEMAARIYLRLLDL